jgi:hypothetical protein
MPSLLDQGQIIQAVYDQVLNRLRVDIGANITLGGDLEVAIDHTTDSIRLGDGVSLITATTIGPKTGLDVNIIAGGGGSVSVTLDSFTKVPADNVLIVGSEDGTQTGTKHALVVGSDLKLRVIDVDAVTELQAANTTLTAISNQLPTTLGQLTAANSVSVVLASDQPAIDVNVSGTLPLPAGAATEAKQDAQITILDAIEAGIPDSIGQLASAASMSVVLASDQPAIPVTISSEPIKISGTIDGTPSGTEYPFVYNVRQQILAAHDREQDITYADFGTKNQRVTQIDYTSATFPGIIARKTFTYTLVGVNYRRDSIDWAILP